MWLTPKRKIGLRQSIIWVGVLILTIAFKEIYFFNSHGVYSDYIGFIWIPPLILLAIYALFCLLLQIDFGEWGRLGLNAGVGTLIVYMAIKGVYEIARVEPKNSIDVRWAPFFLVMAIICMAAGVVLSTLYILKTSKKESEQKETL